MKNTIIWFEINVANLDQAKYFYDYVLQTNIRKEDMEGYPPMGIIPGEGVNGALVEDEEYEDYDDDEEDEDFDESELLAKLTGGATLKDTKDKDEEDKPKAAPTPKKKAVKKTIAKKSIAKKKIVKKAAPPKSNDSDVNMGKGIKNVTCPSCATVHHIDENTPKFICSCGRRIRV